MAPEPRVAQVTSKLAVEAFVRRNAFNHLFEMADLEETAWRNTIYYGLWDGSRLLQIALLYGGLETPILIATPEEPEDEMRQLLRGLKQKLPARFMAHMAPAQAYELADRYDQQNIGRLHRMGLTSPSAVRGWETAGVRPLRGSDLAALEAFYAVTFPGAIFNPKDLESGLFFGFWEGVRLVSVAGVHPPCSPHYGVAVIGGVGTLEEFRGKGLAKRVVARVCQALMAQGFTVIGLHAHTDNTAAITAYQKLGFTRISTFGSYEMTRTRVAAKR